MKKLLPDLFFVFVLIALSIFFIWPIFLGEYTSTIGSIESQYLSHIKFIVENFPNIWWQPFWYTGFPFYLFYQPVLPFGLSLVRVISNLPISFLYRISVGLFYVLGGVGLYFLIVDWTKTRIPAFITALVYAVGPSILGYLPVISFEVKGYGFIPWRLIVLTRYGEGAHIWGLALVPFCLIFFRKLLKNQTPLNWVMSTFFIVLVLLTSITAFMPLILLLLFIWISEIVQKGGNKKFWILPVTGLLVFGLSSFWYNPSFLEAMFGFAKQGAGGIAGGIYANPIVFVFLAIPIFSLFIFLSNFILDKRDFLTPVYIAIVSFLAIFEMVYLRYCCSISLFPFPFGYIPRFGPEVELTFSILLGVILGTLYKYLLEKSGRFKLIITAVFLFLAGVLGWAVQGRLAYSYKITSPNKDVTTTSEYQIAKWFEQKGVTERIYATGTHAQWLNVWTNTPQVRGAADQAVANHFLPDIIYQIYWGSDGELAINWLKALGVKYIVVNTLASKVDYKDFRSPDKFKDLAKPVYEYQGDIIYELPTKQTGLVYKIDRVQLGKVGIISNVLDKTALGKYLAATGENPSFKKVDYLYAKPWDTLKIKGESLAAKDYLMVRISYQAGWKAYQGGKKLEIRKDPLGFMVVGPLKSSQGITLHFSPTLDVKVGYFVSLLTLVLFFLYLRKLRELT